ncbi:hypothetical protein LSAT2_002077 [Lamellibrachia satsuma]|nr:hypothetical protein LSAT2_002077 [Lamellibrachia satsuma]
MADGYDSISGEHLKYASAEHSRRIADMFNEFSEKHLPLEVDTGVLIALPKPDKPLGPLKSLKQSPAETRTALLKNGGRPRNLDPCSEMLRICLTEKCSYVLHVVLWLRLRRQYQCPQFSKLTDSRDIAADPRTLDADLQHIDTWLKTSADLEQLHQTAKTRTEWRTLHRTITWRRCLRARGSAAVRDETKCSYSMEIKTADRSGAGTDNNILAQLSHGGIESDWIMLDNDGKDDFERNQVDTFTFDAKCFKSKPCVEMKNGGLAGWQHFLCRRFDEKATAAENDGEKVTPGENDDERERQRERTTARESDGGRERRREKTTARENLGETATAGENDK